MVVGAPRRAHGRSAGSASRGVANPTSPRRTRVADWPSSFAARSARLTARGTRADRGGPDALRHDGGRGPSRHGRGPRRGRCARRGRHRYRRTGHLRDRPAAARRGGCAHRRRLRDGRVHGLGPRRSGRPGRRPGGRGAPSTWRVELPFRDDLAAAVAASREPRPLRATSGPRSAGSSTTSSAMSAGPATASTQRSGTRCGSCSAASSPWRRPSPATSRSSRAASTWPGTSSPGSPTRTSTGSVRATGPGRCG